MTPDLKSLLKANAEEEAAKFARADFAYWKSQMIKTSNPTLGPKSQEECYEAGAQSRDEIIEMLAGYMEKIAHGLLTRPDGKWGYECSAVAAEALEKLHKMLGAKK